MGGRPRNWRDFVFRLQRWRFQLYGHPRKTLRPAFQEMLRELVDWRLAEYLSRAQRAETDDIVCKVSHSNGEPICFYRIDADHPELPTGETVSRNRTASLTCSIS